jgi:hypothetical protein
MVGFLLNPGSRTSIFHPGSVLRDLDAAFAAMLTSIRQKLPDIEFGFQHHLKTENESREGLRGTESPG